MNHLHSLARLFIALLLAAFALPGIAAQPEKKFSLAMSPPVVAPGASVLLTATIKNETNGNSSINSLTLFVPPGSGVTIDPSFTPTTSWPGTIVTPLSTTSISISNMTPLRSSDPALVLTFKASLPATSVCAPLTWTASAWTGSSFSGDTFRLLSPSETTTTRTTTIANDLALVFQPQPTNALKGAVISPFVAVKATACGGPVASFNGLVTLTAPACTGACVLSGNTKTAVNGVATFDLLKISAPGDYTLTATTPGLPPVSSTSFTIFDGTLVCKPGSPYQFLSLAGGADDIADPGYAAGERGAYNKEGSGCVAVLYTFTNNILTANSVQLQWDTVTQPRAAFKYTVTWKPEYVNQASGLPQKTTKVQWSGVPAPVPGRACLSPNLPAPYGTLAGPIADAVTPTIFVTPLAIPAALPATPFPITIDQERMTVTNVSGTTWTVDRGVGGTSAASHTAFYPDATAKYAMSNPLPLDGDGVTGNQMQMCIAAEVWSAYLQGSPGIADCPTPPAAGAPTAPLACVLYSTTVFDIGDGLMIR